MKTENTTRKRNPRKRKAQQNKSTAIKIQYKDKESIRYPYTQTQNSPGVQLYALFYLVLVLSSFSVDVPHKLENALVIIP